MTGSGPHPSPLSRADRRRATEARILHSARRLFAEKGFDRTTIRAVAASAKVDPALVMQYFGSKRDLFTQAVQASTAVPEAAGADVDALIDHLLTTLDAKLGTLPDGTLATMRSMLTDPAAGEHARQVLGGQIDTIRAALPESEDAELRAALIITTMVGLTIGHQLLGLASLRDTPAEHIAALLRPALKALAEPPA